ncbi:hypothetical protein [Snodgrassella sp. CFCC 13594]|uniref:hypothetical protein n=1 Tax=Snodgrassella sp. CFCC 13594 TaxID=1775559 RepID=UPI00082D10DC|nr:hypothetical protein [Snodgrassella sp. CFCC 13594]
MACLGCWGLVSTSVAATPVNEGDWPHQITVVYDTSLHIPATLSFQRQQSHYQVSAKMDAWLWSWHFVSSGVLIQHTLQLRDYQDIRQGKQYARAQWQPGMLNYGRTAQPTQNMPVDGPVYDVFSLAWQLAWQPQAMPTKAYLTNGKKVYALPNITDAGERFMQVGNQRERVREYRIDNKGSLISYIIRTTPPRVPVRIRYEDDGRIYSLELQSYLWDGHKI